MLPDPLPCVRWRAFTALCCGAALISACAAPAPSAPVAVPAAPEHGMRAQPPAEPAPALPATNPAPAIPPALPMPPALSGNPDDPDEALRSLLRLADRLRGLGPTELALEIAAQGDPGNDAWRQTRLALTLMLTQQPVDTARALGLLQRVAASGAESAQPLRPLARLLAARLLEQRKLEDTVERQAGQLRDQQRRIEQLTERLEAMRAIERSLNTRPPTAPRPVAPGANPP